MGDQDKTIADNPTASFAPGTNINARYRVVRGLGRSGHLELFEVDDTLRRCRRVARLLPSALADDADCVARLRREAEAGSSVMHSGVLRIEGFEQATDGSLFLVTELFEGRPLSELIAEGPLRIPRCIDIAQQIAGALTAIHRTQLVHRDLKPLSILISEKGQELMVKLVDFGLVKATGDWDATRLTQTVGLLGSPEYMSPEHVLHPDKLDARADIYSLGAVLYEMLTGAPPFASPSFGQVLQMQLKHAPRDPRERRSDIPAVVADCVLRALAKSPDQRFSTARQFSVALSGAVATSAPRARSNSTVPVALPQTTRAIRLGSIAIGILCLGAASLFFIGRRNPPVVSTVPPPIELEAAASNTPPRTTPQRAEQPSRPIPKDALFGGRPLTWWSERLVSFTSRSGPLADAGLALLKHRAEANELVVESDANASPVIKASAALQTSVNLRWSEKVPGEYDGLDVSTGFDDQVSQLRTEAAKREVFQTSTRHPKVILAPSFGATAAIRIVFGAGAYHDGQHPGLTRLAQYAMIAANRDVRFEQFALDVDRSGGSLSIETGISDSAITLEASASEFDGLAERLIRMCVAPRISVDRLSSAKDRAIGRRNDGDIDELSSLVASMAFDEPGFQNHPSVDPGSLRDLGSEVVLKHIDRLMSPANATVVVTGAFDARRMRAALASVSGGTRTPFTRSSKEPSGTFREDAWGYIRLVAFPISASSRDEIAAAQLAAAIIEEDLFEHFRGLGIAYSVSASLRHERWLDFILIAVPFSRDPGQSGDQIRKNVSGLIQNAITDRAILRNQAWVIESLAALSRSPSQLADALARDQGGDRIGPDVADGVRRLTRQRLIAIAGPWLSPDRAIEIELSPTATSKDKKRRAGRGQ